MVVDKPSSRGGVTKICPWSSLIALKCWNQRRSMHSEPLVLFSAVWKLFKFLFMSWFTSEQKQHSVHQKHQKWSCFICKEEHHGVFNDPKQNLQKSSTGCIGTRLPWYRSCSHRWCRRDRCRAPHRARAPWGSPPCNSLGWPGPLRCVFFFHFGWLFWICWGWVRLLDVGVFVGKIGCWSKLTGFCHLRFQHLLTVYDYTGTK